MPLDQEALAVLAILCRMRPQTLADAHSIRSLPTSRLDEVLAELAEAGFVTIAGDQLAVVAPDQALAAHVAATASLAASLPDLAREWERGGRGDHAIEVEIVHGHEEQWRAWGRHAAITPPRAPMNLYPTLDVLREVILPDIDQVLAAHPEGLHARAVVPACAVTTDGDRAVLDTLCSAGFQVRLAHTVESWVYADPGVLSALPLVWAEHPPTSILIIKDAAITAALSALTELAWHTAQPYGEQAHEWTDVLASMALGMSDAAIATAQRTSLRTVQRRIAEAMEHHRVGSRFELGVAWAQREAGLLPPQ